MHGAVGRFLNLFTEVRAGEAGTALLLMANIFLILAAYYLLKTIREPLILAGKGGADVKSYAAAAIAGLLIILVPIYSALADRISRVALINGVTLFFIADLVAFFIVSRAGVAVGVPFFIWVGIFNLVVVAQLWAFANDLYTVEQGERLFPIVGIGASMGAIAGSFITGRLVLEHGPYPFMVVAAILLALCMLITNVIHRRENGHAGERTTRIPSKDGLAEAEGRNGFALVFSDSYLLFIAGLMVVSNLVNTTGEYILGETVSKIAERAAGADTAGQQRVIGGFYGDYYTWVNVISALLQAFIVSRVYKYLGIRSALLVLPIVALAGYAALAALPLLGIIKTAKIAENSLDYSLQNTTRNALYLPTSREVKYKAKQANDAFFVRVGDVMSAGLVFAGLNWLGFAPRQFAIVNVILVLGWLGIAVALGRRFAAMAGQGRAESDAGGR
jgi:AAA family ATP:ADP antiporter